MGYVAESLAFVTLPHQLICVLMYGRPIVSLSKCLVCQCSGPGMIATDSTMDFPNEVVPLFSIDAFQIRCCVAAFLRTSLMTAYLTDLTDPCLGLVARQRTIR
ncbi:hypothetical protein L3X38_042245 [Prunus dulcis]|uniref:Uncharacterized protein n=1 Tax=Prunus dulcis TaxID=3755 RepID=A0AAD4YL17_PRUDU|nr:hypothetical protein L3X38_042245 [Prunus dulcis]